MLDENLQNLFTDYTDKLNAFTQSYGVIKLSVKGIAGVPEHLEEIGNQNAQFFVNSQKELERLKVSIEKTPALVDTLEELQAKMEAYIAECDMLKIDNESDQLISVLDQLIGKTKRNLTEVTEVLEKANSFKLNIEAFDIDAFVAKFAAEEERAIEILKAA